MDSPPTSNSHHQDAYIFSRGSQTKPSFATGILVGRKIQQKSAFFESPKLACQVAQAKRGVLLDVCQAKWTQTNYMFSLGTYFFCFAFQGETLWWHWCWRRLCSARRTFLWLHCWSLKKIVASHILFLKMWQLFFEPTVRLMFQKHFTGFCPSWGWWVVSPTLKIKGFHTSRCMISQQLEQTFVWLASAINALAMRFFFSFFILSATSESALFFVKFLLDRKCGPWTAAFQAPWTEFHDATPGSWSLESECACFVWDVCGMWAAELPPSHRM